MKRRIDIIEQNEAEKIFLNALDSEINLFKSGNEILEEVPECSEELKSLEGVYADECSSKIERSMIIFVEPQEEAKILFSILLAKSLMCKIQNL